MKPLKGLSLNTSLYDVPQGHVVMARNAINSFIDGSITKEKGFIPLDKLPYTFIGSIETPIATYIYSTNNTYSAISKLSGDILTNVIDDKYLNFKFGFRTDKPIKGIAVKNYKDEWIGVFNDDYNKLRIINFDAPLVRVESDLSLFPIYSVPNLTHIVQNGGTLVKGTYIPFIRYSSLDFTYTDFIPCGKPIYVAGSTISVSSKQISLTVTNLDTRYKYFEVGFYQISAGVEKAYVLDKRPVDSISKVVVSSMAQLSDVAPEDLLVNAPFYTNADNVTFDPVSNRLVLLGVQEPTEISLQSVANNIKIRVKSTLVDNLLATSSNCKTTINRPLLQSNYGDGNIKTFMGGETYAFYLVGVTPLGRRTRGFIIPGREATANELSVSIFDNCRKVFQIEDTSILESATEQTFIPGYWENADELYPNLTEYGVNAGKPVRHHVMPTIAKRRETLYSTNANYGRNTLDVLGIIVDGLVIPDELSTEIVSYEIYYAKRTLDNQRVLGQSLVLLGTKKLANEGTNASVGNDNLIQSTGGNWDSYWGTNVSAIDSLNLETRKDSIRLHGFDLLVYKPIVDECGLQNQLKLRFDDTDNLDYNIKNTDEVVKAFDYTDNRTVVSTIPVTEKYRYFADHSYLPSQAFTDQYDNRGLESAFIGLLNSPLDIEQSRLTREGDAVSIIPFEETYLSSLLAIKNNIYQNFQNQELVYTGSQHTSYTTEPLYVGDAFISDYSFITYGLRESGDLNFLQGNRYVHRFICETNGNAALRYQDTGDLYSYWYPKSSADFLKDLNRGQDPNQFRYDQEWNRVYDLARVSPYNALDEIITDHPYRAVVSQQEQKEKGLTSIRTFAPLDYIELKKERGRITGAEFQDGRLVIQFEHTIVASEGIQTLGDSGDIYLKTVNLIDQNFVDVFDDNIGILGSNQKFAFYKTPLGIVIIDQLQKNVYIYKQGLKKLNVSLNTYFKQTLNEQSNNPFTDKGYLITYDSLYNRLLLTQKGDVSYTVSYDLANDNWVSFHDYIPNGYFRQREGLYCIKNNRIYKMNVGSYGNYFDADTKPFYIDVPFSYQGKDGSSASIVPQAIGWLTTTNKEFTSVTHITAYTPFQCTGRVGLFISGWRPDQFNYRKTNGYFWFNKLKDIVAKRGTSFLQPVHQFNEVIDTELGGKNWYDDDQLTDKVIVVRLEDNNLSNQDLSIQEVLLNTLISDR